MRSLEEFTRNFEQKLYNSKGERIFARMIFSIKLDFNDIVRITQEAPEDANGYVVLDRKSYFLVEFYRLNSL